MGAISRGLLSKPRSLLDLKRLREITFEIPCQIISEMLRVKQLAMTVEPKRKQTSIEDFFNRSSKKLKISDESPEVQAESDASFKVDQGVEVVKVAAAEQDKAVSAENVKEDFKQSLSGYLRTLLAMEIDTIETSWFVHLKNEFKKPYFVKLKQFVTKEQQEHTVFPPAQDVYSWSRLTPFDKVKVVIIGQDPYHNFNQAHGMAFSVKAPTPAPPSLKNIYKELKQNYSDFQIDNSKGDLTPWALQGVLLLNTALTVRAHNANSHSKKGWEVFTKTVVQALIEDAEKDDRSLVFLLWGNNASKLVETLLSASPRSHKKNMLVFKSVHPSPLSANRGFFGNNHFRQINDWLHKRGEKMIDWSVVPGSELSEVTKANRDLVST